MRSVTILGSTGSVGKNTLQVIRPLRDRLEVRGLAVGSNTELLKEQVREFSPKGVYVQDPRSVPELSKVLGNRVRVFTEEEGLEAFTRWLDSDILVAATNGTRSLLAVTRAIEGGKIIALANKEILVAAGGWITSKLRAHPRARLIPVDSEHSAIFQCLQGYSVGEVERLLLTGSGGPLREIPVERFREISKETVVAHPRWKMGPKISVDSATLMNKGLELIEAFWLFGVPIDRIELLIHPEAVVHSMVEFRDGAILAQLGVTDMRLPIRYALCFPERLSAPADLRLDWSAVRALHFSRPDRAKFPCLELAYQVARRLGSDPCVLSAADEVAVNAYLEDRIRFVEIPQVIEKVLSTHRHVPDPDLDQIQSIHRWATEETRKLCRMA